uniref:ABC transporter domain-containing protein n=1 Tax=Neobodo designis TaxID=312471 RepID=A0A7S1MDZ8_NEODS
MVGDQPATDAYRAAGASDADADHAAVDTGATDADAADTMSEEELAAMFAASAESWTVTLFLPQTYAIFVKKLLVLRRSARLLFMSGVLPLVFIIVGFLTAIPNFLENVDSETWPPPVVPGAPDMSLPLPIALHPTPVIPQDNNNWYQYVGPMHAEVDRACFDAIVSAFEGAHADYRATTDPTLPPLKTAVLTDPVQIQTGAFLDTRSISPVAKLSQPPPVLFINGCPANSLSDVRDFGAPFVANFTWMYQYPGQLQGPLLLYDMLLRTALTQLGTPPGQPKMAVPRAVYEPLPLIKSTWYVPQPVPPKSYIETVLAVITVVAVTLYSGSQALLVAEEMNKGTFELLRMQGLHAVSYWVGTYAFDLLAAAPMVGLFIAGAWIRDIEAMKQGCMVSLGAASLVALISFALLFAYALVSLLPRGLSQGAYVAAVLTSNVLLLALPFLIVAFYWADAKRQGVSADEDSYKWTWYITPQRAFMILLSMQADLPYTQCVWTRGPTPRWGLVCIAAWHAVPVVVLWLTTHRDRFSRPPRLDDTEGEATGAAGSNGSEATHLLPRTTVAAGEGDATEEEDVLADPDVRREHHRVGRRALAHDPSQPTDLRKFGERMRGGATTVQSPASADSAALDADRDGDMLLVRSLRKLYRTTSWLPWRPAKEKLAVRGVSLGLRAGECFGLLGPNGAGKTTTVKMMLREHNATTGAIDALYVPPGSNPDGGDSCCAPSRGTVYRGARYGVCPQFDALWDQLTAEEHMAAYLRIRLGFGYRGGSEKFKRYVKASLAKVQLDGDHLGKPSEAYSGGMKRKLSVCIALFTGAAAVFLDEPSTGMDPHARRALWQSIHEALLRGDRCVLLTTHSMEEADAVCGRIAIVTDGVMRCIGSSHHLKQRFGSGYSVTLTLNATAAGGAGGSNRSFGDAAAGVVSGRSEQLHTPRTESERLLTTNAARNSSFGGGRKGRRDAVDPVVAAEIDAAMKAEFGPTCELAEALGLQRRYAVAELASPAAAFATLAARRAAWGLESYSLAHLASLEQIFLHFAGAGDEDDSEDATGTDARAEVLP